MRPGQLVRRLLPLVVAAVTLMGALAVFDLSDQRARDVDRSDALRRAGIEAVALQRQLDRALNAPIALAAHIQMTDGRVEGFEEFAGRLIDLVPSITNLQLAPDGVVQHIHPLPGNEAAIGHELLVDRERSTEAFAAVESRRLTLAGPFELVQGGIAMVGRQPIYLPQAGNVEGVDPDFWGFATVLINLDDFFGASRVSELLDDGYHYDIAKFDRDQDAFVSFRRSGESVDPVKVDVSVANGTWQLSLGRPDGWGPSGRHPVQYLAAGAAALLAGLFVFRFQRRRERLVAAVDERTSELRAANEELIEARDAAERANNAKTAFLSNVSHELRTPMNAIIGFAELIDPDALDDVDRDSILQIQRAGEHLLQLINEVLDITAIESGRLDLDLEPVAADEVIRRAQHLLSPLADEAGVTITVNGTPSTASAHPGRLFQIVSNLVANAVRFTPRDGHVELRCQTELGWCRIDVVDDGVGIADEHLDRIFDPFERGDAPVNVAGSGMGLAIVDRLVTAMGGDVRVTSAIGVGSTFSVWLPAVTTETEEPDVLIGSGATR